MNFLQQDGTITKLIHTKSSSTDKVWPFFARHTISLAYTIISALFKVVHVGLYVDGEVVGCVSCEFIADRRAGINSPVLPRLDGQCLPLAVFPMLNGIPLSCNAHLIGVVHHLYDNGI